jgi:hypothetical protein
VLLLTSPLKNPESKRYGLGANGILRRIARWCTFGAIGIVLSEYVYFKPLYVASSIVFSIGLISLFLLLANVADWVRDDKAKKWLEYAAWGASFFYIVSQEVKYTYERYKNIEMRGGWCWSNGRTPRAYLFRP